MTQLRCENCRRLVSEVEQEYADKIAGMEGKEIGTKAYECRLCEALIFEDELEEGRFAPKQPRRFWT